MSYRLFRAIRPGVASLAVLVLLATCTEQRSPLAPGGWRPTAVLTPAPAAVLVGAGDIAQCDRPGDEATAALLDGIPGTVVAVGDNAYPDGSAADYQNCYEPSWGRHKARTRPVPGNHEYLTPGAAGYFEYFGAAAGEPGKGYYSYDLGDWHIIALNNYVSMAAGSEQEQWLLADLAAHPNLCTLAYWHHPLYSSWTDAGTGGISHSEVKPVFVDLYNAGVDVVFNGHRHWYERFAPQNPDGVLDSTRGIRVIIAGTGGGGFQFPTNVRPLSEVRNSDTWGVLKFYLYPDSYAWKFTPVAGKTFSDSGSYACHDAPGGVSGAQSTVTAAPTTISAGTQTSTITVTAKDGAGRPVAGATVVLAATGSGNTLAQPASLTDANGVATGTLTSTVTEAKMVSATANGIPIAQTATVTVTNAPSASKSQVKAAPVYIAPGTGTSTITVTVKDAGGHAIAGAAVVLAATGSGNTLTQPGPTNASGVAKGTLSSTVPETKVVSATANGTGITKTATVIVTTPSASKSTVAASPTSITAGSATSTITVTVKDAGGHAIAGAAVVLEATGSGNTLTQPGLTNASGVAKGTLSSTVPETKVVSATATGIAITKTVTVTVTPSAVSPSLSTVVASPTSITAGSGTSTITVTVKDATGKAISGATVVLAATGNGNTLTQPAANTNSNGVTSGTLSSTVAEVKTVSATANGIPLDQTATVTLTTGGVSPSQSTLATSPTSIVAGSGTSTITVTARDAAGNPVSGAAVVLATTGSGNTLTQPAGPTDANGVATGTLSSTVLETKTVSATANGTAITQTATVTVTPGGVSASQSMVVASPTSITAGGSSTITVTVQDADGNPISGATVVLAATGSGKTLAQPSSPTDANGVATGTLSSIAAGTKTVSATANGTAITQAASVTVTAGPLSASQSTVTPSPAIIVPGTETSTITVTANDAYGNPISGAAVLLAATGSGNTLTQPSGPSDANGVATGTLSSTVEESKTVSATVDGTSITQTATVTVASGVASVVLVGAGNIAVCDRTNDEATAALLDDIAGTVFTGGDNAVVDGSPADFTNCYDPSWGRHKARTRPAVGDKEYLTAGAAGYGGYFGAAAGEAGSYYYSYDVGDWHIIVLNDNWTYVPTKVGSVQEQWLQADLAASTKQCTLAIWHQPRFSSSSSTPRSAVKTFWDDLYAAGAEVVVNAHFRNYERFAPQTSDGVADPQNGIRQFVVGTGGQTGFQTFTSVAPNSEVRNSSTFGVLKLTLSAGSYAWEFIPAAGGTFTDSGNGTCH
ncbi:MAG TPA: invasin domain 3-containing protein [Gemmatimonadales bacterium]|nr:invasin domain 3-containing protein [Gemmatimonadales bacterium]